MSHHTSKQNYQLVLPPGPNRNDVNLKINGHNRNRNTLDSHFKFDKHLKVTFRTFKLIRDHLMHSVWTSVVVMTDSHRVLLSLMVRGFIFNGAMAPCAKAEHFTYELNKGRRSDQS
ncbi:hypothetical protein XENORESO_020852 [Xenotaenia resolanae]|uniref:Uncharacterized protein n=1 Tax=Xenotaenia resolanae TaxID=208358 RepID=A0ABV0W048_9TELE